MRNKILTAAALLCMTAVQAQTPTPTKIKVFTPEDSKISKDNSYKWTAKTDLLAIVTGEFPIIGEYRIADKFSIEGSAALTYAFFPNDDIFDDEDDLGNDTKAAMGSAFRGTIKYYPSSDYDAIEGWSFGLQLFYKTNNRAYEVTDSSVAGWDDQKDKKVKTGVSLIISKQIFEDSNISFESYVGVGVAKIKRTQYGEVYDATNDTYGVEAFKTEKTAPNIQLGFRIGFGN